MKREHLRTMICLTLAVLMAGMVGATTLTPMTGQELAAEADLIVVGRCTQVTTRWFDRSLVTLVTVTVDESLKGEGTNELTLALPGGIDHHRPVPIAVTVPGVPALALDDELLLFLDPVTGLDSTYQIVGFSQGLFPIFRQQGDKAMVAQSRTSPQGALPLAVVRERIATYLKAEKASQP